MQIAGVVLIVIGLASVLSPVLLMRQTTGGRAPAVRRGPTNTEQQRSMLRLQRGSGAVAVVVGAVLLLF